MTEDYEYYDAQGAEEITPLEALRPAGNTLDKWRFYLYEKNYSRDKLEELLARAMYVLSNHKFKETL